MYLFAFCTAECGQKNTGKRVVGGANTEVNEYPWMVALYKRGRSLPSCGGTLINSR
jgi:secreted trypsin-like serine protease